MDENAGVLFYSAVSDRLTSEGWTDLGVHLHSSALRSRNAHTCLVEA